MGPQFSYSIQSNNDDKAKIYKVDNEPFTLKKGFGNEADTLENGDLLQNGYLKFDGAVILTDLKVIDNTKDLATYADGAYEIAGNTYQIN